MLITISNGERNITFEGKLSPVTRIHNFNKVRTLAGAGYTFNNGTYRSLTVNVIYMNKVDIPVLENIILNGVLDIETEVGDNYYRVACVNESLEYTDENETQVSVTLNFETNILNNIRH